MGNCLGRNPTDEQGARDFQYNLVQTNEGKDKVTDHYILGQLLGEGITGKVHLVYAKPKPDQKQDPGSLKQYAMKSINLSKFDKSQLKELENEIDLLRSLDHPNIIKVFKVYKSRKNIHIIMELLKGGELSKRILRKEGEIISVSNQILSACKYWHSRNIVHRDLKLENVMFICKEGLHVKIIDFGLGTWFANNLPVADSIRSVVSESKQSLHSGSSRTSFTKLNYSATLSKSKLKRLLLSVVGTAYFMSPEIILNHGYDNKCDVYSIGVIIYILVTHKPPFQGKTEEEIFFNATNKAPSFESKNWQRISPHAQTLVKQLLEKKPTQRISAGDALKSEWFNLPPSSTQSDTDNSIISSFQRFCTYKRIKQAGLMVIAYQRTSGLEPLKKAFEEYDVYKTGTITFNELKMVLERNKMDPAEIANVFKKLDMDKSGQIRFMEFLAATIDQITESEVLEAFDHLDADKSGYITKRNLKGLLGKAFSKKEIESIVHESDLTGDRKISKPEFIKIMNMEALPLTTADIRSALREEINEHPVEPPILPNQSLALS